MTTDRGDPDRPIVFGHRGAAGHGVENTLEAFRLALRLGATGIESDAWLAADGVPVLVHDGVVLLDDGRARVRRRTSADLARAGIPTLAETYAHLGTSFAVSLDIKHADVARPVIAVASQSGALDRLWLCHEAVDVLADLRPVDPTVRLVLSREPRGLGRPFSTHVEQLASLGIDALNLRWRSWTRDRIRTVRDAGLEAFAWDVHEPADIDRLIDLGVNAIYSDFPERVAARVEGRSVLA